MVPRAKTLMFSWWAPGGTYMVHMEYSILNSGR